MAYDKSKLSQMSGESAFRKPKALILDEIKINGKAGHFSKVLFTKEKKKDEKTEVQDLGKQIKVVFLKIRRKLSEPYNPKKESRITSEHNGVNDMVMMFGPDSKKGVASDLRKEFDGLKTIQIVYCIDLATGNTVRLAVRGASLGSDNKAKDTTSFYDYLTSFKKSEDEHFYEYETVLTAITESGQLGAYYCMDFKRGDRLSDEMMESVAVQMEKVHKNIEENDNFYSTKNVVDIKKAVQNDEDTIPYPTEDINEEDIPF